MKLHETVDLGLHYQVIRVPGGWIYHSWGETAEAGIGVFVPYNDEFHPDIENQRF